MLGEIGSTERDMKHRIFRPFRLKLVYGKSFEQVFPWKYDFRVDMSKLFPNLLGRLRK